MENLPKHIRDAVMQSANARCGRCGTREAESYGQSVEYGFICHRCAFLELVGPGGEDHPNCPPLPSDLRGGAASTICATSHSTCTGCGSTGGNLRACAGTCGGRAAYCSRECQMNDFKSRHKRECWRKADTDTFVIPHPHDDSKGPLRLKAYRRYDGYGRDALQLNYSDDVNEEPSIYDIWCAVTSPVSDEPGHASLQAGEAVFNTTKYPTEVEALLRHGIIKDTGKKIKIGYYSPHPVCRINLPVSENVEDN